MSEFHNKTGESSRRRFMQQYLSSPPATKLLLPTLRGVGQIMLQRHALSGVLFLCGIAVNSIPMALAAMLGAAIGTILGQIGRFPPHEVEDGLYGFNGALVALAAVYFYSFSPVGVLVGAVGIVVATMLMYIMQKHSLLPFTFPFIATVWVILALLPELHIAPSSEMLVGVAAIDGVLQAFGQVMFQGNSLTGLFFISGLLVNSRGATTLAVLGAALGVAVAVILRWPTDQMAAGIFGYNAILAAIAIPLISQRKLLPISGALLSIAITKMLLICGIPALTFPFVLSVWMVAWYDSRGGAGMNESK